MQGHGECVADLESHLSLNASNYSQSLPQFFLNFRLI